MVNGSDPIYIEREGKLHVTDARFIAHDHLRRVIERIVGAVGRRIDESSPMVDARLPDGSRVNAIIPPLSVDGPSLTIRKFSEDPYTADDLVSFATLTPDMVAFISACVRGKLNVLITGGTGTGKTTLLNVVSSFIPTDERIVTIEDAVELRLHQENIVRLEARPANIEGKGQVTIRDLLRNALRMRPDRIIVGEVRGGEALDMLQAMNTGHEGSLSTVHANTPRDALARVETMVLMSGMELPTRAIREQIASAIDVIVHLTRFRDGTRRVSHITEVEGMEGEVITLQDVFLFDYSAGIGEDGRFLGCARPTGLRPKFSTRLSDQGIALPADIFGAVDVLGNGSARRY
jgi:pilus assembly protein CpaF